MGSVGNYRTGTAGGQGANPGQYIILNAYNSGTDKAWLGGNGGDCLFGNGGVGGAWADTSTIAATNGIGFGGGGAGGATKYQSSLWSFSAGSNGANGFLRIRY